MSYKSDLSLEKAELLFTKDSGRWQDRKWEILPAGLDIKENKASAVLPKGVKVYFINLIDKNGLVVSSEHEEMQ